MNKFDILPKTVATMSGESPFSLTAFTSAPFLKSISTTLSCPEKTMCNLYSKLVYETNFTIYFYLYYLLHWLRRLLYNCICRKR